MIPQWWLHLLKGEKITFYNLQLFVLKSEIICQESPRVHAPWLLRRRDLLGLRPTDSWTLVTLSGVRIVIGGPEGDEPASLRSPQVPWVLDQLENLTPVWKFVEAELPSEPCLNNLERLRFVMFLHKRSSAPSTKASLDYFLFNI